MTTGGENSGAEKKENIDSHLDDALSSQFTVQACASTLDAVGSLRAWVGGKSEFEHCLVIGPSGSGRTHLLDAVAGVLPSGSSIRCSPSDANWGDALKRIDASPGLRLIVDDLDKYDESFRKLLLPKLAALKCRAVCSLRSFDGKLSRSWERTLSPPLEVHLEAIEQRAADVIAFLPVWIRRNGGTLSAATQHPRIAELLGGMTFPRGFADLSRLLGELVVQGTSFTDEPNTTVWVSAYSRIVLGPRTNRAVILVEGKSDALYFEWVSALATGAPPQDVEIEPCHAAKKIPPKAFAYRNEQRSAVALFDCDTVGRDLHRQMKEFELRSVLIKNDWDPLAGCAPDHVHQVVEIEDLLPIDDVERFFVENKTEPELVIEAPRKNLKRIVVDSTDKHSLAKWAGTHLDIGSASKLLTLYNELREKIGLPPLSFPKPSQ